MDVTIRTEDFMINIEIPLHPRPEAVRSNRYPELRKCLRRAELELECPDCDKEFYGDGRVGDLAAHFNEAHWGRRVERRKCRKAG